MMFEIDKIEATDIDEPVDFTIAEILYKSLRKGTM
jgi:CMP-N-acetylneuraminic acid synthetase